VFEAFECRSDDHCPLPLVLGASWLFTTVGRWPARRGSARLTHLTPAGRWPSDDARLASLA